MEDSIQDVEAFDDGNKEISGPLDVRRLQGNARCSSCKANDKDCYLERGNLRCLTCKLDHECIFRRVVVREGAASNFSWEELIKDDVAVAVTVAAAAATNNVGAVSTPTLANHAYAHATAAVALPTTIAPLKRRRSIVDDQHPPYNFPGVGPVGLTSQVSEPASQNRTHVSSSPFASRNQQIPEFPTNYNWSYWNLPQNSDIQNAENLFDDTILMGMGDPNFCPWAPGQLPPDERQSSVLGYADYQLAEVDPSLSTSTGPVQKQRRSIAPGSSQLPDLSRTSATPVSDAQDMPARFQCEVCKDFLNTRSEHKKHMARHRKPFACNVPGCPRMTDGFATRNDLDRHETTVHDKSHGEKMFRCSYPSCKDPNKVWKRKDNFRAHVKRMHPQEDIDAIVERSCVDEDMYESVT